MKDQLHCQLFEQLNFYFDEPININSTTGIDLEDLGLPALSMRVRTGRNLSKYPLPGAMTKEDRINMEKDMGVVFD